MFVASLKIVHADTSVEVAKQPDISLDRISPGQFIVLMLDLSIPDSLTGKSPSQLVPGLGQDRTTYCHWLQTDLAPGADGFLASDVKPIAAYRK